MLFVCKVLVSRLLAIALFVVASLLVLMALLVAVFSATCFCTCVSSWFSCTFILRSFAHSLWQWNFFYFFFQEFLYLLEVVNIVFAYEGYGNSVAVGTCCTSNSVYIIFCIVWYVIVDNHCNIVNVNSSCQNIGSYKHINLSALELEHHFVALRLV